MKFPVLWHLFSITVETELDPGNHKEFLFFPVAFFS